MKDSRFDHEGACSQFTVHSRLGLPVHRSKLQLLNAGSLELGKESLQYRLNVAQEENRSERVTLLNPDVILDDDRIGHHRHGHLDPLQVSRSRETPAQDL